MSGLFHISTREHGALLLLEAVASAGTAPIRLQDIAQKTGMSLAYLEEIAGQIKQAGLIKGKQGPGGGYVLAHEPQHISVEDILIAVNGPLALVECQQPGKTCPIQHACSSQRVWNKIQSSLQTTLRHLTLADALGE